MNKPTANDKSIIWWILGGLVIILLIAWAFERWIKLTSVTPVSPEPIITPYVVPTASPSATPIIKRPIKK